MARVEPLCEVTAMCDNRHPADSFKVGDDDVSRNDWASRDLGYTGTEIHYVAREFGVVRW
jgi:hypothetical protein